MNTASFAGFELTLREQGIAWFEFNTPQRLNGMTASVTGNIDKLTIKEPT